MKHRYEGSCHCGEVKFRAILDLDKSIVCDCSICRKKGSIISRADDSGFELLTSLDELSVYTFNKNIAKHYFCPKCGVHPFHHPRSYPELWGINVRCLKGVTVDDVDTPTISCPADLEVSPASLEGTTGGHSDPGGSLPRHSTSLLPSRTCNAPSPESRQDR